MVFMILNELISEDELFCNDWYKTKSTDVRQLFLYRKVNIYLKACFSALYWSV